MGTTSEKLTYLNTTKGKIKDSINLTGANITTEPFRQYSTKLEDAYIDIINNGTDTLYNNFPKVSSEGTSLTLNNTYQAPMRNLLKGNTSQTGTPTPSSPIPVNVVSGDNSVVVCGKNLLNNEMESGTLDSTGQPSSSSTGVIRTKNYSVVEPNTQYKLSNNKSYACYIYEYDKNYNFVNSYTGGAYQSSPVTITTSNTTRFIKVRGISNQNDLTVQYMLNIGTSNIPYEPYNGDTYSINLGTIEMCKIGTYQDQFKKATGKNLAPINLESETYNTLEITNNNNGTFTLYGNPTGSFGRDIATNLTLKAGTYTISANAMPSGLYIALDNEADTQLSNGTLSKTFTLASDTTYTSLGIWFTKNKDYDVTIKLQIEKSSSATEWQPKEGWYKEKQVGKVVFNGSENWNSGAFGTNSFTLSISDMKYSPSAEDTNILIKCSHFKGVAIKDRATSGDNIIYAETSASIYIRNTTYSTLESFKTMLGTNNMILYYVLVTPTNEPIPSNLINQLEELYIAKSKENQTNISQINNDLGFIISTSALKKG